MLTKWKKGLSTIIMVALFGVMCLGTTTGCNENTFGKLSFESRADGLHLVCKGKGKECLKNTIDIKVPSIS